MAGLLIKELKIRGLIKRILIVTPANLTFQWQREMQDKFREQFEVIRGDVLRANYGQNPWQEQRPGHHLGLLGLAHRGRPGEPAAQPLGPRHRRRGPQDERLQRATSKTLAYQLGRGTLRDDRPLPADDGHAAQGRSRATSASSCALLDEDVYGDVKSLEEAMRQQRGAVLPAPDQGGPGHLPRPGDRARSSSSSPSATCSTVDFELDGDELDFYDALTRYVEDQSIKAAAGRHRPRPGPRLHHGHAPAPLRLQRLRRAPQPGADEGDRARRSSTTRSATARSRSPSASPTTSTTCPRKSSRRSWPSWRRSSPRVDPAALREEIAAARQADRPGPAPRSRARSRPSCTKLQEVLTEQGHLRRPEDEAARLHRAQGHARLPGRRRQDGGPWASCASGA